MTAAQKINGVLKKAHPDAKCALVHKTPLQLLVATILSAQCTDERVNIVTRDLFAEYTSATDYAAADPDAFAGQIRSTGFFLVREEAVDQRAADLQHRGDDQRVHAPTSPSSISCCGVSWRSPLAIMP